MGCVGTDEYADKMTEVCSGDGVKVRQGPGLRSAFVSLRIYGWEWFIHMGCDEIDGLVLGGVQNLECSAACGGDGWEWGL